MKKVKALNMSGEPVEGYYLQAPFIKLEEELTEEELEKAIILEPLSGYSEGTLGSPYYVVIKDAVQVIEEGATLKLVAPDDVASQAVGSLPVFVEVDPDSIKECTGLCDKNGKEIFVGDKIRYQAGIGDYEEYEVVFTNGRYTTSPAWPWGCNYSPFGDRCKVINM